MRWKKTGRTVKANGESTITYSSVPAGFTIESRKKAIPHANGVGFWMHTTYFLIDEEGNETEYNLLVRAKMAAENAMLEVVR